MAVPMPYRPRADPNVANPRQFTVASAPDEPVEVIDPQSLVMAVWAVRDHVIAVVVRSPLGRPGYRTHRVPRLVDSLLETFLLR